MKTPLAVGTPYSAAIPELAVHVRETQSKTVTRTPHPVAFAVAPVLDVVTDPVHNPAVEQRRGREAVDWSATDLDGEFHSHRESP